MHTNIYLQPLYLIALHDFFQMPLKLISYSKARSRGPNPWVCILIHFLFFLLGSHHNHDVRMHFFYMKLYHSVNSVSSFTASFHIFTVVTFGIAKLTS